MLYCLVQGPVEQAVLRQAYRRGVPPPDAMANAPELPGHLVPFWEAFDELDTCRQYVGMAGVPAKIPWTAIALYADKHGFAGDGFDDLLAIVRALDDALIAHARKARVNGDAGAVQPQHGSPGSQGF